jgi:hypothetical protein
MAELLGEEWDVSVGIISWWLGVSNLRPLAFSLEFVAAIFVSVRHASLHITLVVLVNSNALELDIIDWWLGWISVWISGWWFGSINMSPFTFTLEVFGIANFLVSKSIAFTHSHLVFSINRDASEFISDWWFGWISVRVVIGNPLALIVT